MRLFAAPIQKKILLLAIVSFTILGMKAQNKQIIYSGTAEYASGGFGGYDPPQEGDSVIVTIDEKNKIFVKMFDKKIPERIRYMDFKPESLELEKKELYMVIETIQKSRPSGNYDMRFSSGNTGGNSWKHHVHLKHYSNGEDAYLTIISEYYGFFNDILRVKLQKK